MYTNKSFTLIELVMVIAVLAILAVVVIPRPVDTQALRIDMAARKVQSDIRYAQSLAVSIQKRTGVNFRTSQDDYSVSIEDPPGNWTITLDPLTKQDFTVQLNNGDFAGVEIELVSFNGESALVFDQWGNPYGYNVATEASTPLDNPAGVSLTGPEQVRVERGTGRVFIE